MLALLFSLAVQAQEIKVPVIDGNYQVSASYEVVMHMRWERVSSLTTEGQNRIRELQADGYTCTTAPSSTYNCTKHLKDLSPNEKVDQAVEAKWKQASFTFYSPFGEAELVNNTEFYKQYSVSQKVVLWEIPHQKEAFMWNPVSYNWIQGSWKVYLGSAYEPESNYVSLLVEGAQPFITELMDFEKGWIRDRYFIKIPLLQKAVSGL